MDPRGDASSGDLGDDNEEFSDEGDDVLELLMAAASRAGLYRPRLAWTAEYLARSSDGRDNEVGRPGGDIRCGGRGGGGAGDGLGYPDIIIILAFSAAAIIKLLLDSAWSL